MLFPRSLFIPVGRRLARRPRTSRRGARLSPSWSPRPRRFVDARRGNCPGLAAILRDHSAAGFGAPLISFAGLAVLAARSQRLNRAAEFDANQRRTEHGEDEGVMARESVWQRRARKCRSAKAEYYPKVDLTEIDGRPPAAGRVGASRSARRAGRGVAVARTFRPPRRPAQAEPEDAPPPERSPSPAAAAPAAPARASRRRFALPDMSRSSRRQAARQGVAGASRQADRSRRLVGPSIGRPMRPGAPVRQANMGRRRVRALVVNCAPRMIEDLQLLGIDLTTLTSGEQPQ